MGGPLAALWLLAAVSGGCDEDAKPAKPLAGRSNAVLATGDAGAAARPASSVSARPAQPAAPRSLCVGQQPRPAPTGSIGTAAAGFPAPPVPIPFGAGKWVWLNLWAAWCGPCKEEMPRLIGWQSKLRSSGILVDLAFVSLDDDERQLQRFLEAQPAAGVRASYWLPEGAGRTSWLASIGQRASPELPVHALVSPSGQVACIIQGAVEDRDYDSIAAFLRSAR